MTKVAKTIKIESTHEEWLKSKNLNFSEWVRNKLDEEILRAQQGNSGKPIKAVILAAGEDKSLFPLTEEIPKTLLDIKGKTILDRQIQLLRSVGIYDIAVVRGYKKHRINYPDLLYFDNDSYDKSGSLVSLFAAIDFMDTPTIVLYGDILFESEILARLVESKGDTTLVMDRGWKKRYQDSKEGIDLQPELVKLAEGDETTKVVGIGPAESDLSSEFIGLAKLSISSLKILDDVYKSKYLKDPDQKFHNSNSLKKASLLDFVQELIEQNENINALEIWRSWIDVDTFEDYRNSWKLIEELDKG
jgi:phosphoenolpyruvate phosphomutase